MLEKEVEKILHLMYSMDRITKWALKLSKNILHTKGQNQFRQWRESAICFANLARKTQINDSTFNMYAYKGACISIYERTARFELCLFCYGFQGWISLKVFFFCIIILHLNKVLNCLNFIEMICQTTLSTVSLKKNRQMSDSRTAKYIPF